MPIKRLERNLVQDGKEEKKLEKELIAAAAKGDTHAYRLLVEAYHSRLYRIAFEIMRTAEDAEDILQEAFVKAYLSLPSFKGDSSFYTWIYRIVYNMAIDIKRKHIRRGGDKLELTEERIDATQNLTPGLGVTDSKRPDELLIEKEELQEVNKALAELTDDHRDVIVMREVDGLSYDEIADVLKISRGTVMSRLFYARKRLQEIFLNKVNKQDETIMTKQKLCFV